MKILSHLEPRRVFHFFEALCAIPHGSGNTRAISDYCVRFAAQRGLEVHQDGADNVILIKPATPGYEQAAPIILQGHLDMVCEREAGCRKDMAAEGLDLAVDGDSVYARGTTLGGDDGIAVAMILALLDADDISHPRLEAVLTSDEEIGMLGAAALDVSPLTARTLINLDSEEEGVFTVSCAGGNRTVCSLPLTRSGPVPADALRVRIGGLRGGHSGTEIDKGRANANLLLGRVLQAMAETGGLRLICAGGGQKDNAIPTQAAAEVLAADPGAARRAALAMGEAFAGEFRVTDPGVTVTVEPCAPELSPLDGDSTRRALCLLACAPNGVQAMSAEIEGLVQTSLNLGVLRCAEDALTASFSVRSSVESQKEMLVSRLRALMSALGGSVEVHGDYAAWAYLPDSPLRERMVEVYQEQYGAQPQIAAIHAGLECGVFSGKLPGLDCVSIGPDLHDIHTPRERMSIASVGRVWRFLLEVLRRSR